MRFVIALNALNKVKHKLHFFVMYLSKKDQFFEADKTWVLKVQILVTRNPGFEIQTRIGHTNCSYCITLAKQCQEKLGHA